MCVLVVSNFNEDGNRCGAPGTGATLSSLDLAIDMHRSAISLPASATVTPAQEALDLHQIIQKHKAPRISVALAQEALDLQWIPIQQSPPTKRNSGARGLKLGPAIDAEAHESSPLDFTPTQEAWKVR